MCSGCDVYSKGSIIQAVIQVNVFLRCAALFCLRCLCTEHCLLLQEMKLRLISIFIITQKGITDSEKEELFLAAQLSANERQVLYILLIDTVVFLLVVYILW
jgi:hypothetical protein